jgi:hypothetical protein
MTDEGKEILLKNIETYVDKMIAEGHIPPEKRDEAIAGYKAQARIS